MIYTVHVYTRVRFSNVHVAVAKGGNPGEVMPVYSELNHTESQCKMVAARLLPTLTALTMGTY